MPAEIKVLMLVTTYRDGKVVYAFVDRVQQGLR